MVIKNPKFEISATSPKQYPKNNLPEIVRPENFKDLEGYTVLYKGKLRKYNNSRSRTVQD